MNTGTGGGDGHKSAQKSIGNPLKRRRVEGLGFRGLSLLSPKKIYITFQKFPESGTFYFWGKP